MKKLPVNPAVAVGLGHFGGATLCHLAKRLQPIHPALFEGTGWLWLTDSGWRTDLPPSSPNPLSIGDAPSDLAPELLTQAFDQVTSQANLAGLKKAGYDPGSTLDVVVAAHANDPLTLAGLGPLLDLARAQAPEEARLTLVLACDSRRFSGPSASDLVRFFDALADQTLTWCYLCDTLDAQGRVSMSGGSLEEVIQAQVELMAGFLALLLASDLRREPAYSPQLAHEVDVSPGTALANVFGLAAYVMPVDAIAARVRDQLALRLHQAAFPKRAVPTDWDAAWAARDRLLAAVDLSPQGLGRRLLRGADGTSLYFDTRPPDLSDLDRAQTLKVLARWRSGLEEAWQDQSVSPPDQVGRNAQELFAELAQGIEAEVDRLVASGSQGIHRAMALLDELPQTIEAARVQVLADDKYYRKRAVPSVDQKFRELGESASQMERWWWPLPPLTVVCILIVLSSPSWLASGLLAVLWFGVAVCFFWDRRRRLTRRQAEFIDAVQLKYQLLQDQAMHVERREIFDKLLRVVRGQRQVLFVWKDTLKAAQASLAEAEPPSLRLAWGERPLCQPEDYPSPVADWDQEKIADIAAAHLRPLAPPLWRESDVGAVLAWLRQGAEAALVGWRRSINALDWQDPDLHRAIARLAGRVQPQWPLTAEQDCPVEVKLLGLPDRDALPLSGLERLGEVILVSTGDPARLTLVVTCHGLPLPELDALRPLWPELE